jgi:hypothetical protein
MYLTQNLALSELKEGVRYGVKSTIDWADVKNGILKMQGCVKFYTNPSK